MTYTNTFLYLYVLLVLCQTVLSPVGVTEFIPIRRYLYTRMKISVSMDISVLGFYGYIGDISVDIFT